MINWNDINLKNRSNGKVKTVCPACSHNRKNKKDPCLSVSIDQGLANCWNCGEVSVRDLKKKDDYKLPNQQWTNYTKISDKLVKWFKDERNISQQTIIDCKITEEEYYQPALSKKVNNIVFNYFEGTVLVNKKYRSGNKKFTQTAGTRKILFGLNHIIGCDEIYIVEGEMDKLAFWEAGYKNCVSVPNGAKDLSDYFEECEAYLKDVKKVFIAVDTDEDGKNLERELIKRFGKWRSARIEFDGEKDANDLLKKGILSLQKAIENPNHYPVDGTFTAEDIKDDLLDYYDNGMEECPAPKSPNFAELNKVFKIMMGQLTVVTGIPSHGKSNFIEDYVINIIHDYKYKASFYSPEHFPMKLHHGVLAEKVIGKPFEHAFRDNPRMTKEDIDTYIKWSKDKIYITYPEKGETVNWKWLLDKFKEQLFRYGIDIFVIDAFNKVKRNKPDSLGEINDVLSDLCQFAQAYNVHVFLIAHPVKMQKDNKTGLYAAPTLYDVKGSGDFRDQAHNGLCVYRYFDNGSKDGFTEVINLKTKFKNQGKITGSAYFKYDYTNGRYYDKNGVPDRLNLFDEKRKEIQATQISVEPEIEEFEYDDLPF
ncbi:toprim domain-containing protein [Formosa sp. Hel1_33_131]|uniref:toprim domain-containing protein n=1 Tax=Formosa sp. Hel1_33_131 TaxID=1336794 RepID=UPI00084E1279|nr:toprim domain-containing protein [Formosa sp. Hel1_33_131]